MNIYGLLFVHVGWIYVYFALLGTKILSYYKSTSVNLHIMYLENYQVLIYKKCILHVALNQRTVQAFNLEHN